MFVTARSISKPDIYAVLQLAPKVVATNLLSGAGLLEEFTVYSSAFSFFGWFCRSAVTPKSIALYLVHLVFCSTKEVEKFFYSFDLHHARSTPIILFCKISISGQFQGSWRLTTQCEAKCCHPYSPVNLCIILKEQQLDEDVSVLLMFVSTVPKSCDKATITLFHLPVALRMIFCCCRQFEVQ